MKKIDQPSRLTRIKKLIYDPDTKSCLGRTAKNWILIFIFYVCAYTFLAGFFVGMLSVFLYGYISEVKPTLSGRQSILSNNPALEIAARPNPFNTFIQLATYSSSVNDRYIKKTNELFEQYNNHYGNIVCGDTGPQPLDPNLPCRFEVSSLGPCSNPEQSIKQTDGPCLYFKLNRIYGWLPELANKTEYPNIMIQCHGANELDKEAVGDVIYHPSYVSSDGKHYGVISTNYFPYIRQPGYHSALVAVQFPRIQKNLIVMIECQLFGLTNGGSGTKFELTVDNSAPVV